MKKTLLISALSLLCLCSPIAHSAESSEQPLKTGLASQYMPPPEKVYVNSIKLEVKDGSYLYSNGNMQKPIRIYYDLEYEDDDENTQDLLLTPENYDQYIQLGLVGNQLPAKELIDGLSVNNKKIGDWDTRLLSPFGSSVLGDSEQDLSSKESTESERSFKHHIDLYISYGANQGELPPGYSTAEFCVYLPTSDNDAGSYTEDCFNENPDGNDPLRKISFLRTHQYNRQDILLTRNTNYLNCRGADSCEWVSAYSTDCEGWTGKRIIIDVDDYTFQIRGNGSHYIKQAVGMYMSNKCSTLTDSCYQINHRTSDDGNQVHDWHVLLKNNQSVFRVPTLNYHGWVYRFFAEWYQSWWSETSVFKPQSNGLTFYRTQTQYGDGVPGYRATDAVSGFGSDNVPMLLHDNYGNKFQVSWYVGGNVMDHEPYETFSCTRSDNSKSCF